MEVETCDDIPEVRRRCSMLPFLYDISTRDLSYVREKSGACIWMALEVDEYSSPLPNLRDLLRDFSYGQDPRLYFGMDGAGSA